MRGVLAEAVTGYDIEWRIEGAQDCNRCRENRGLRVGSELEVIFGTVESKL